MHACMHVGSRHVGPPRLMYVLKRKKEPDDEELKKKNRMEWMMKMKTTQKGKERHLRSGQGRQVRVLRTIDTNTGINYLSEH